jgi:Proteasome non-ATPase 26S subunit
MSESAAVSEIHNLMAALKGSLDRQDAAAMQKAIQDLSVCKPTEVTSLLASAVFVSNNNRDDMSDKDDIVGNDALTLLGCLIQAKPQVYLKPSARAIHDQVSRLDVSDGLPSALVPAILQQIVGDDVEVSSLATDTLVLACQKQATREQGMIETTWKTLVAIWQESLTNMAGNRTKNSTISVRCATTAVALLSIDDAWMMVGTQYKAVDMLSSMLTMSEDPLLQMSVLDILEGIANKMVTDKLENTRWLWRPTIIHPLVKMAGDQESEADPILGGPAILVLTAFCQMTHTVTGDVSWTMDLMFDLLQSLRKFEVNSESDRLICVNALASLACMSDDSLTKILREDQFRQTWLNLSTAQPKLKAALIMSVAHVIQPSIVTGSTARSPPSNAMQLYAALGQVNHDLQTTQLLMNMAKSPVLETRLAVYTLWRGVAMLPTGSQVLLMEPGFVDFLLERTDTTKDSKQAKYDLVEAVYNSPVRSLLADGIVDKLKKHVQQGPFYAETVSWDLATE